MYATIEFNAVFGPAIESEDPHERNSNLLPVKANGEVLLRSVESFGIAGRTSAPIVILADLSFAYGFPSLIASRTL